MTQRDRVLKMLRDAGSRGIHTFELRSAYIGNPSQRVNELRDMGYEISASRERLHGDSIGSRYVLHEPTPAPALPPEDSPDGALFEMPPRQPEFSDIVYWDDAA